MRTWIALPRDTSQICRPVGDRQAAPPALAANKTFTNRMTTSARSRQLLQPPSAFDPDGAAHPATPNNEVRLSSQGAPSMRARVSKQTSFIKNNVPPTPGTAGLGTKTTAFDHNKELASYTSSVMYAPTPEAYVAGSATHGYEGLHLHAVYLG